MTCGDCIYWSIDNTGSCGANQETGGADYPACTKFKEVK